MKQHIFYESCFYSHFQAPNSEELTDFVYSKDEVYKTYEWAKDCSVKTIPCKWEESIDLLTPSVYQFADSIGSSFNWTIYNPWINCYRKGDYQEMHEHSRYDFSCVFFPEVKEDYSKFCFYNRHSTLLSTSWIKLLEDDLHTNWYPDIKSGDIIFFAGTLLHGVTQHRSNDVRKTLSCNFDFDL